LLTPAARAIFVELACSDRGDDKPIMLSVRDAMFACNCSTGAVARGFRALVDAGFIVQVTGRQRFASTWRIAKAA
jgi:DNA-binding transcriptional regulator YhcF (GntR family)